MRCVAMRCIRCRPRRRCPSAASHGRHVGPSGRVARPLTARAARWPMCLPTMALFCFHRATPPPRHPPLGAFASRLSMRACRLRALRATRSCSDTTCHPRSDRTPPRRVASQVASHAAVPTPPRHTAGPIACRHGACDHGSHPTQRLAPSHVFTAPRWGSRNRSETRLNGNFDLAMSMIQDDSSDALLIALAFVRTWCLLCAVK